MYVYLKMLKLHSIEFRFEIHRNSSIVNIIDKITRNFQRKCIKRAFTLL